MTGNVQLFLKRIHSAVQYKYVTVLMTQYQNPQFDALFVVILTFINLTNNSMFCLLCWCDLHGVSIRPGYSDRKS